MNCAENLLEPTIFFSLYTKSPLYNSGSESPWCKRDLSPTWNLDIKSWYRLYNLEKVLRS